MIWNVILFHKIFIMTLCEILRHLGYLPVKMALPIEVSAMMVSYSFFYWKKYDCSWGTKGQRRCDCNISHICLILLRCHWSSYPWGVEISDHWSNSDDVGQIYTYQQSPTSQGAPNDRFQLMWWSEKIWAGNSQKSPCILYKKCILY